MKFSFVHFFTMSQGDAVLPLDHVSSNDQEAQQGLQESGCGRQCHTALFPVMGSFRAVMACVGVGLFSGSSVTAHATDNSVLAQGGSEMVQSETRQEGEDTGDQSGVVSDQEGQRVGALGYVEPVSGIVTVHGKTTGVIKQCLVVSNQRVKKGDLLAVFSTNDQQRNAVKRAEITVTMAENKVEMETKKWNRWNKIRPGAISQQEKDLIDYDYQKANDDLALARTKLECQHLLLEDTMVRAPMDGIVLDVIAKEGQMTDAEGVVLMGDVDHMNVVAEIHEEDVAHVRIGQPALLTPDGTKDVLRGKVLSIGRMIRAAKLFPNDPKKHQDIRIVEVTISVPRHEALQALVHRKVHVRIGSVKA